VSAVMNLPVLAPRSYIYMTHGGIKCAVEGILFLPHCLNYSLMVFICSLFNDAFSVTDYTVSNKGTISE
jgi:hypothetical protein